MRSKQKKYKFSKGEINERLLERQDLDILESSGSYIKNFISTPYGGAKVRNGTMNIDQVAVNLAEITQPSITSYAGVSGDIGLTFYSGIEGYWKCEDTSTPLVDSFSGTKDLDYVGTPTSITGKLGLAHGGFASQTDYFRADYSSDWNITGTTSTAKATVEAWVKFGSVSASAVQIIFENASSGFAGANDGLRFGMFSSNSFGFGAPSGTPAADDPTALEDGEWHYVVGVLDNTLSSKRTKLYVDGVEWATSDTANGYTQADGYICIGGDAAANQHWRGAGIDDVVYWHDTAMTQAQVTARYASGDGVQYRTS